MRSVVSINFVWLKSVKDLDTLPHKGLAVGSLAMIGFNLEILLGASPRAGMMRSGPDFTVPGGPALGMDLAKGIVGRLPSMDAFPITDCARLFSCRLFFKNERKEVLSVLGVELVV